MTVILALSFIGEMDTRAFEKEVWYEPRWSGVPCSNEKKSDVSGAKALKIFLDGEGSASCKTDCDCPSCAPFCSSNGFCRENDKEGRKRILQSECSRNFPSLAPITYNHGRYCKKGCTWNNNLKQCVRGRSKCDDPPR